MMDEQKLVDEAAAGDDRAFEALSRLHERRVFALCQQILQNRHDAEDACVETFMRAYQHLRNLRAQPSIAPWLRRTATNLCISMLRRRGTHREELLPEILPADEDSDPTREVDLRDDARLLRQCMERMSAGDRAILMLRYVEDHSLEEVSQLTRCPRALLKVRLHRARKRLQRLYEQTQEARPANPDGASEARQHGPKCWVRTEL